MWWSSKPGRNLCHRSAALVLLACLTGCGFSPLYGGERGAGLARELAAMEVVPIDGPYGAELRNQILHTLPLPSTAPKARYRLAIQISTRKVVQLIEQDARTRRFDMILRADFELRPSRTGDAVTRGAAHAVVGYNVLDDEDFANLIAERSAGRQAAREVGREIVSRLSLYFNRVIQPQA